MTNKSTRNLTAYAVFIGAALLAGYIGSAATFANIPTWYATLTKPGWTPPNWVFGPVWTTLYVLMGSAAALVWNSRKSRRRNAVLFFLAHLVVNAAWSIVFFGLHDTGAALGIIMLLWIMIATMMFWFWRYSRVATYLLAPYLVWVSYASTLNAGVYFLN